MTSIVRKVLRRGSGRSNSVSHLSPPSPNPKCPPSPDLTGLSAEEIGVLMEVLQRQEEFEMQEKERQMKLTDELQSYESLVKQQASLKSKFKHVDLRLCRLCYKTKFADGIGKACYDCHKRVCNKCGSYTQPKWNPKKNKISKGKWRCNMCSKKREILAKTGTWYHGGDQQNIGTLSFRKKFSISEMESSDDTGTGTDKTSAETAGRPGTVTDSEVFDQTNSAMSLPRSPGRRQRKRSVPEQDDMRDEDEIDAEEFQRERQMCRTQRHQRTSRRRRLSSTSVSDKGADDIEEEDTDLYETDEFTSDMYDESQRKSSTEYVLSSDVDSRIYNLSGHSGSSYTSRENVPFYIESSHSDRSSRKASNDSTDSGGCMKMYGRDEMYSDDNLSMTKSHRRLRDINLSKVQRQDAVYYSSSSSIISEEKCSDMRRNNSSPSPVSSVLQKESSPSRLSVLSGGDQDGSRNVPTQKGYRYKRQKEIKQTLQKPSSANSLSPDVALTRHRRRRPKLQHALTERNIGTGHLSPNRTDGARLSPTQGRTDLSVDIHGRRMTLSNCQNIILQESRGRRRSSGSKPHEIILHRDKSDLCCRTNGLGMRVVGGKTNATGVLSAYVTMITQDGPAERQGICKGDQILEWNGRSLVDVTFEEAGEIIAQSGNIIQVTVLHDEDKNYESPMVPRKIPVVVRAESLDVPDSNPPSSLSLNKPKRRMLPKTPIEIKKDVRKISGKIWMQLDFDSKCHCLLIVLLRGEELLLQGTEDRRAPNPMAMMHLLPHRHLFESKETEPLFHTTKPEWNETFVFPSIHEEELSQLALEVTIWNYKEVEDEFLGEVLLDLAEAKLDNTPLCYNLEDHDDNSSPLPYRKKSFSLSDTSIASPCTSLDASSLAPSRNPSPRSSLSKGSQRALPITPAHDKLRELLGQGKRSPGGRDRTELSSSAQSSPLPSPVSPTDPHGSFARRNSLTTLLKKKVTSAMARVSSSLVVGMDRSSAGIGEVCDNPLVRSQSFDALADRKLCTESPTPRKSFEHFPVRYDLLAPPHPLSRSNSSSDFFSGSKRGSSEYDPLESPCFDRPTPEGNDITSMLGPGQISPKPSHEKLVYGDIKMGFMVSKGQLEIDIIVVKGLDRSGLPAPPDTYVKTYLVEGTKTIQKRKTQTVKLSFEPVFRKRIKYSACNIHGRCIKETNIYFYEHYHCFLCRENFVRSLVNDYNTIADNRKGSVLTNHTKVNVWEKQKTFDKKQCLGEAVVKLDNLDLCQHTLAWYKLFQMGAIEFGSTESLYYW